MHIPLPYVFLLTDIFTPTQPSSSESYLTAADTPRLHVEPLTGSLKQSQYLPYRPRVSHGLLWDLRRTKIVHQIIYLSVNAELMAWIV